MQLVHYYFGGWSPNKIFVVGINKSSCAAKFTGDLLRRKSLNDSRLTSWIRQSHNYESTTPTPTLHAHRPAFPPRINDPQLCSFITVDFTPSSCFLSFFLSLSSSSPSIRCQNLSVPQIAATSDACLIRSESIIGGIPLKARLSEPSFLPSTLEPQPDPMSA